MNLIHYVTVVLVGSTLGWVSPHARAGCDATVSATAIQLARQSAGGDAAAVTVALETFSIDPTYAAAFQPMLEKSLTANAPKDVAAALTSALRQLCGAFAGHAAPRPAASATLSSSAADEPAPRSKSGGSTSDAMASLGQVTNRLDTSAPPGPAQAGGKVPEAADGLINTDTPVNPPEPTDTAVALSWLARPQQDRTRQQIELDMFEAKSKLDVVKRNRESNDPQTSDADVAKAKALFSQAEQNALLLLPNYGLYFGPNYTQNSAGGFDVGVEAYAHWDSGRYYYGDCDGDCKKTSLFDFGWYRGFFDASFQAADASPKAAEGMSSSEGGEAGEEGADDFDIFGRDNGRLRLNAGLHWHPFVDLGEAGDWMGFVGGVGFTAPQVAASEDSINRGGVRLFAGLHSMTRYRYGLGEVTIGYAKDRFWKTECGEDPMQALPGCGDFSGRYFLEGIFNLVNAEATDWSLVGKLSADIPTRRGGESDVVISVMLRRDLSGGLKSLANP